MTTVNLLKKHFKQLLYWTASNWHYILIQIDTTAISNQIKYYLTKDSGSFLEMQYGFYKYALLADLLWLVAQRAFTKNLTKAGTCLFGASLWKSLKFCDWSSAQVSLFLLTGKAGIVNVRGWGMHWYLSWLARLRTLKQSQTSSPILLKVWRNFKESLHFDLLIQMSWKSNIS